MSDKDLSTNGGPQSSNSAATANLTNAGTEANAATRTRRHRRPAHTTRAADSSTESPAEATPAAEATALPVEAKDGAAQNAIIPAETNRATRSRRGSGRTRNEKIAASAEANAAGEGQPTSAEASVAARNTPPTLPSFGTFEEKQPVAAAEAPSASQSTASTPAGQTTSDSTNTATEAPRSAHRYRFDRRPVSSTVAPTTPPPTPPASELRRSGPFSTIWARNPSPTKPPVEEVTPLDVIVSTPMPVVPLTPAPTPIITTPVHAEPEEIVLPLVTPPTPIVPQVIQTAPEIQVIETIGEDESDTDTSENSGDEARRNNNRRRRRGGRNGNGVLPHVEAHAEERTFTVAPPAAMPSTPTPRFQAPPPQPAYQPPTPTPMAPPTPEASTSAYGSPEPAHARGFGPVSRGVASEYRTPPAFSRSSRTTEGAPISANHLAGIIMEAMQQQTDRLLSEQRRHGAASTFTIAMPSTERVGIFVDVANLLYSSRSMRLPIDFGRLLNFLRGDRRLVRAHAYCPTSPDPYADQQFLQAVKGLGYRITTKDYKTFSSGAKKS